MRFENVISSKECILNIRTLVLSAVFICVVLTVGVLPKDAHAQIAPTTSSVYTTNMSRHVHAEYIMQTSCSAYYTVVAGDWLSRIAQRYGVSWQSIAAANGITNPNLIYPGQRFCIPGSSSQTTTTAVTYTGKGPNSYPWGQCTWGAEELASRDLNGLGNAGQWTSNAAARGIPTGYVAVAGSTAVFQPGYSVSNWGTGTGHVAHVNAVSGNMMQITEMNNSYYGGFGQWDTVWIAISSGVSFIY